MSSPPLRRPSAVKIQELYAHADSINSIYVGRKSTAVIATGGQDTQTMVCTETCASLFRRLNLLPSYCQATIVGFISGE